MLSTFRKETVQGKLPSSEQLKDEVTDPEIDEIADSFDDYHPNTPSSSVEDDEDLVDREKNFVEVDEQIKTLEDVSELFCFCTTVNAIKFYTLE